jgi:pimeloyl-ACP methyl ester carboxylesterase
MQGSGTQTGYAQAGDLRMYYEIHGSGRPVLLLHGAYMSADTWGPLLPGLAASRRIIAPEQQGHGRTSDIDRPITYEQMADDTAALARALEIETADVLGYSMGGGVALQLAIRHPDLVRKLVVASASFRSDAMHPEAVEMFPSITPEMFAGTDLDTAPFAWPEDDIRSIAAPTLIMLGDSDLIRLEHAVEMFRLLGGGVMGDLAGVPSSQLAVLPGTTHFMPPGLGIIDRTDWLLAMIVPFLDAPTAAERDEPDADLSELVDEFGDRSGPDPTREPELELGEDEVILEPAPDDD